jgi:hypothetical protein
MVVASAPASVAPVCAVVAESVGASWVPGDSPSAVTEASLLAAGSLASAGAEPSCGAAAWSLGSGSLAGATAD